MTTLAERLRLTLQIGHADRTDLADACGISSAAVSKWFTGNTTELKADHVFRVARLCNVDPEWLATGRGRPTRQSGKEPAPSYADFEPKHIDLLRMYRRLPEEIRRPIRQMIEVLAAAQRESYSSFIKQKRETNNVD